MLDRLFVFLIDIFFYHLLVTLIYGFYYSFIYVNKLFNKSDVLLGYSSKYYKIELLWSGFKQGVLLSIPYRKPVKRQKLF